MNCLTVGKFIPFDDAAVIAHLTGRHVMGVYPLLEDENCWFLAVDFDKSTWTEDMGAFAETCRRVGLRLRRVRAGWAATSSRRQCHAATRSTR